MGITPDDKWKQKPDEHVQKTNRQVQVDLGTDQEGGGRAGRTEGWGRGKREGHKKSKEMGTGGREEGGGHMLGGKARESMEQIR